MSDETLKLECLKLAGGDVGKAKQMYEWLVGPAYIVTHTGIGEPVEIKLATPSGAGDEVEVPATDLWTQEEIDAAHNEAVALADEIGAPQLIIDGEPPAILRSDLPPDADLTVAPSGEEFVTLGGHTHLVVSSEAEAESIAQTQAENAYNGTHELEGGFPGLNRDDAPPTNPDADVWARGHEYYGLQSDHAKKHEAQGWRSLFSTAIVGRKREDA